MMPVLCSGYARGDDTTSETGFSIIELLVTMAIMSILAMLVVPQLLMAWDRGRQRRSLADMRDLSMSLATYQVDGGSFPIALADLSPKYYGALPNDGWGQPYTYVSVGGGCAYVLTCFGTDRVAGPAPPDPWMGDVFAPDIQLVNGSFMQAPGLDVLSSQTASVIAAACS